MNTYVDVIVDISHSSLDRVFQYAVPNHLLNNIKIGMSVNIPFGKGNKIINGYIIRLTNKPNYDKDKIKEIESIATNNITIESHLINLAVWMKERYACTIISALKTLIPLNKKINKKTEKIISLNVDIEVLQKHIELWNIRNYSALSKAGRYLLENNKCTQSQIIKSTNISASVLNNLEKKGIIKIISQEIIRNPYNVNAIDREDKKIANEEQLKVIREISNKLELDNEIYLIHGITGSGKTEVYMQIIEKVLDKGQQAIVLIPEISLTPQTVRRFIARFGNKVGVIHSRLSSGERYDQWRLAKQGKISIMIGPRSAIFAPFDNLGIIIIDEEHEMTYKSEVSPKYHAREVAIKEGK